MPVPSVMIVENNTPLRNTLRRAFEDRGYEVWTCPAPAIAVSLFKAVRPTIVILDFDFGETDLLGLLDQWIAEAPRTRVIVESTTADARQMRKAIDHGAQAFLVKPYSLGPLFEILDRDAPRPLDPTAAPVIQAAA